ncbi:MAG: SDR family oxidoreductase [Pseudolabrys sp.]|nr:SDR family oxidoreductase [Pseudolabrys sp.]MDP2295780.1 SDR family oxidoreductase [Pseudolabrys sp.]
MADRNGRVVLLTGAAGGLGSVMAKALLEAGHSIAAADLDGNALARLLESLNAPRERLLPVPADVSAEDECNAAIETTIQHFGRIDGLINNAGIGMSSIRPDAESRHPGIEELTPEIWDRFYMVNVRGPMMLTRAAVPHMRKAGWGRIVNNTTSYKTMLRVLPYGAMKSALESMSAVWAQQLDGSGITVNVLIPGGPTDTPFIADAAGWPRDKMLRPAIMAAPAVWLMSEAANSTTGRRITASEWDVALPPDEAAAAACRGIGWPELVSHQAWW